MKDYIILKGNNLRKNPHAKEFTVKDFKEAKEFKEWFNKTQGTFFGNFKRAFAMSHSQCSKKPLRMFIVDKDMVGRYANDQNGKRTRKNFFFPNQLIFNAKILSTPLHNLEKGSKRTGLLKLKKQKKVVAVPNTYLVEDACMSFPANKPKNTRRFNKIRVSYQVKTMLGGLKTIKEDIKGMKSHMFQHEVDHQRSMDIYMKGFDKRKLK